MLPEILMIVAGAYAAAFVAGAAGFGDALVASAIWLQFLLPVETVPLVVACFFTMHVGMLFLMRKHLDFTHLWPFLICGAIGVPIGVELLKIAEPGLFKKIAGAGLMTYGIVMLVLRNMPNVTFGGRVLDGTVGGIGGVLGGFAGLSGFMPGLWCAQRGWSREQSRGVTQPYILAMHGMALGWLLAGGMVVPETGIRYLIAMPAVVLGAWTGVKLYRRLNDRKFRQAVLILLAIAGVVLLANPGGQ